MCSHCLEIVVFSDSEVAFVLIASKTFVELYSKRYCNDAERKFIFLDGNGKIWNSGLGNFSIKLYDSD